KNARAKASFAHLRDVELQRADAGLHRARLRAVTVAAPPLAALIRSGADVARHLLLDHLAHARGDHRRQRSLVHKQSLTLHRVLRFTRPTGHGLRSFHGFSHHYLEQTRGPFAIYRSFLTLPR